MILAIFADRVQFELKQNYLAAQASKQLLDLHSKAVVPQSSLALESSMPAYEVGNVDFLMVLSNFITILNQELVWLSGGFEPATFGL